MTTRANKVVLGFWLYLMSDCVLFASLFAVYVVLHHNTNGGPSAAELFSLPFVLMETLLLLTSSFIAGLSVLAARSSKTHVLWWLTVTLVLGLCFVGLEVREFAALVGEGHSWQASGFLSSFFALVGTHGLHVALGSLWLAALMVQVAIRGLSDFTAERLFVWSLFWHFLDIVWIFIFTVVYLLGALAI